MKFISVLVLVFFCSTSFGAVHSDFKRAVDVLHYRLTVEWDQKSPSVRDRALNEFKNKIEALKEKGMTDVEIQNSLIALVKNPELKKEILLQNGVFSRLKTTDEIMNYLVLNQDKFRDQGASYVGREVVANTIVALVIATIITVAVVYIVKEAKKANKYVCTKRESREVCKDVETCDYYETTYYYDNNGNQTGTSSSCASYSVQYEQCSTVSDCVEGYYRE